MQETRLRVWANVKKHKQGTAAFSTWLHRVLHNLFVDQHRRHNKGHTGGYRSLRRRWRPYAQRQTKSQVDKLLWQLPDNQCAALLLFHQQGLTPEVAAILGLGERAASRCWPARRAFRQSYTSKLHGSKCREYRNIQQFIGRPWRRHQSWPDLVAAQGLQRVPTTIAARRATNATATRATSIAGGVTAAAGQSHKPHTLLWRELLSLFPKDRAWIPAASALVPLLLGLCWG